MADEPRLGIFWIADRKVISYSVPVSRAERAGGYANYPHGHAQLWPMLVRAHPRLRELSYDAIPRGRVTFEEGSNLFRVLLPSSVVRDRVMIRRLIKRFSLAPDRAQVQADEHYGDPKLAR